MNPWIIMLFFWTLFGFAYMHEGYLYIALNPQLNLRWEPFYLRCYLQNKIKRTYIDIYVYLYYAVL